MGELEKAHLQAGRRIKNKIKETISKSNITQLLKKGFQEFSLSSKGGGSLQVYKIIEKGKTLKVKFSYTDKPLDPKEFLK
jgi:acyl CoA:acetate/3-ketoacid CoA transferase alpha subunit